MFICEHSLCREGNNKLNLNLNENITFKILIHILKLTLRRHKHGYL